MPCPKSILELVARFNEHREAYGSGRYNETQLRREFLDPLFEALGWDVANRQGHAEAYKDVIHEDQVKVGGLTKAPDYSFRVGGTRKFFVEAKKPAVNIKADTNPAYQLRRYAWSAKLPLSILTDFEELAVYDCRVRPAPGDKASIGRTLYIRYDELPARWDELEGIFGREAVLRGSFDRYADSKRGRRGTAEVDDAFLQDIEGWRELLARNLALRNPELVQRELNFAVQRIIDRIVFLRICEDRGLEQPERLRALVNGAGVYPRLVELFREADARYNSGLFHFREEKERDELPDDLTPGLVVDDKALKEVITGLYYPESPYEFSVLPADILGQVYEQFLGKVIRLTAGHRAVVEEKPEVKKAGGVYYTPTYIVDYIVRQTVGKLLEGRTPRQADRLTALDPACGSGSFLIGAYQYLLDWYRDRYVEEGPEKHRKVLYQGPGGAWRLTAAERKRILLNSIFGVDIDPQAVEVTKLSLLLKVLEGETSEALQHELSAFRTRALPDLGRNIKCGNSLIGPDFYDGKQLDAFSEEERIRINAFDWRAEFPQVFGRVGGGFDAVIGNPPYVRSRHIEAWVKQYLISHGKAGAYQPDTFAFFIEKGIDLLKPEGRLGMIIPNGLLTNTHYRPLREYLLDFTHLQVIVDLKDRVFSGAHVDTSIIVLARPHDHRVTHSHSVAIGEFPAKVVKRVETPPTTLSVSAIKSQPDAAFNTKATTHTVTLTTKIKAAGTPLGSICEVRAGMKVRSSLLANSASAPTCRRFLAGTDIAPYAIHWNGVWVNYDRALESRYTNQAFRDEATFLARPKVLVRQVMGEARIIAALDYDQHYVDQSLYVLHTFAGGYLPEVLQALLSSRVLAFYFTRTLADGKATFPKIKGAQLKQLPLPDLRRTDSDGAIQRSVVELVSTRRQLAASSCSQVTFEVDRTETIVEQQLDRLVYELYGLEPAEISFVEEATQSTATTG